MRRASGKKHIYIVHDRIKQRISWLTPKIIIGVSGSSLAIFSIVALISLRSTVQAFTPPLVLGELPYQKLISKSLTDRGSLAINVANGNLVLQTQDLSIGGVGPKLSITRYFNDMATGSGQAGNHSTLSVGADVHVTAGAGGSAVYQGPSGFKVTFPSNGSGGYTTPAEYTDATLAPVSGGGWTLTQHKNSEVYTFNAAGDQISDTDANGLTITYAYNSSGTLASATDAQGRVTTFTNYSGTNVGKITDPSGRTINYTYTSGNLTGVTDAAGNTWQYQYYDTRGNVNQITDPRGYTTTLAYDSSNRITSIKYNDFTSTATTWTYTYNNGNSVVKDPLNHNTTYTFDTNGRVTSTLNAVGSTNSSTWDINNNQSSIVDPSSYATTLSHDSLNNLTAVQNPSLASGNPGAKASFTYGNAAHPYLPVSGTDSAGNLIAYSYNTNGNLVSAASTSGGGTGMGSVTKHLQGDPNGSGGTYNCSAKTGEVCASIDANGNTTSFAYDTNGNVTTVTPPGPVAAQTYTYDSLSRPITYTNGNGSKVTITYDNDDRPTKLTYATGGAVINYYYDANGNLAQRDDGGGQTFWTMDGYNKTTKIRQTGKSDLNYTYDAAGNLKTEQGPAGTITYTYDNANQIAGVNQSINGANETFVFTDGRPTTVYLPGSITETIGYDRAGRETSIKAMRGATTLTDYTGSYVDAAGHDTALMQSETNNLTGITTNYSYDGLNRLTGANATGTGANSYTYTYDNNGNRTQYSHNGSYSAIFGFNAANELTTTGGAPNGSYDGNANQTSAGTGLAMSYNAQNQTASFTPPSSSTISAGYLDADQKGRTQIGSTSEQNGLLGLYGDTTGSTSSYYTHLPTGTGQVLGETMGASTYYYLPDLRGSIVKVTDGIGTVQNTYSYDPYGSLISSTGSVSNPWRYAGGYYDSSTTLYKFGERYYNSSDARWTQLDPTGQNPGYQYAGDDPINQVDPSGTESLGAYIGAYTSGCVAGAEGTYALAGVSAAATGGQIEISGGEIALGCALGGAESAYDSLGNTGGGAAVRALDAFDALKGLL